MKGRVAGEGGLAQSRAVQGHVWVRWVAWRREGGVDRAAGVSGWMWQKAGGAGAGGGRSGTAGGFDAA